ncbi:MAG: helix-turn-helix domain-containing protein [Dehalococcoidales bacterium]|nr:helix-turn-helix domain-containing protein [Dehalococcoidales bacterium]
MDMETTLDAETDLLPEHCHYRDEGCELAESCLNCPFPECIFDEPGGKRKLLMERRNGEIARLYDNEKKSVKELARIFNLSIRTIQRALKEQR